MKYEEILHKCAQMSGYGVEQFDKLFLGEEGFTNIVEYSTVDQLRDIICEGLGTNITIITVVAQFIKKVTNKQEQAQNQQPEVTKSIESILKSMQPISQWSDMDLLRAYVDTKSEEYEIQLNLRSKGRRFVITKPSDSDNIDIDATYEMLKRSRKEDIPEYFRKGTEVIFVHRISDLNKKARTRHVCPICGGILFDSFCSHCDVSFVNLSIDIRQFIYIMAANNSNATIDWSSVINIAQQGLQALINTYPKNMILFNEMRETNILPTLIKVEKPVLAYSDPFKSFKVG